MRFNEYDVVALSTALPENGLKKGQIGTVLVVYQSALREYEVEFCDDDGRTLVLLTLKEEMLEEYAGDSK